MTAVVCRLHPSEVVSWKGTGCRKCSTQPSHRSERRRNAAAAEWSQFVEEFTTAHHPEGHA